MAFTFRLGAKVKFNRSINTKKDYISPGGYCFSTKTGKKILVDFEEYYGCVEKSNPCILDYYHKYPNYFEYEKLTNLIEKDLQQIESIDEFFIHTGEPGENDLVPVELMHLYFEIIPFNGEIYEIEVDRSLYAKVNDMWKEGARS